MFNTIIANFGIVIHKSFHKKQSQYIFYTIKALSGENTCISHYTIKLSEYKFVFS